MRTSHAIDATNRRYNAKPLMLAVLLVSAIVLASGFVHAASPGTHNPMAPIRMAILAIQHAGIYGQAGDVEEVARFANEAAMNAHEAVIRISGQTAHGREAVTLLEESITHFQGAIDVANTGGMAHLAGTHITSALDFAEAAGSWCELRS
jgi:hypothetical protein